MPPVRPLIVRITRNSRGWCFPGLRFQIEVFVPVSTQSWERRAPAVWSGDTACEAVANFRKNRELPRYE